MGGRVSYLAACALPDKIRAAVPFYGGGIPIDRTATLKAPVLAFFGEDDPFIPLDQVKALEAEADAAREVARGRTSTRRRRTASSATSATPIGRTPPRTPGSA